jgi:hypothetical protein
MSGVESRKSLGGGQPVMCVNLASTENERGVKAFETSLGIRK